MASYVLLSTLLDTFLGRFLVDPIITSITPQWEDKITIFHVLLLLSCNRIEYVSHDYDYMVQFLEPQIHRKLSYKIVIRKCKKHIPKTIRDSPVQTTIINKK